MAGSFGYGPLLGKPVIKPAFPLSGQCAGLISTLRISVCCAAEGGGLPSPSAAEGLCVAPRAG